MSEVMNVRGDECRGDECRTIVEFDSRLMFYLFLVFLDTFVLVFGEYVIQIKTKHANMTKLP